MENFKQWLREKHHYVSKTVTARAKAAADYEQWLIDHHYTLQQSGYTQVLDYIGHLREQGSSNTKVRQLLWGIKQYYQFHEIDNPAASVMIRNTGKKAAHFFSEAELERIHENFTSQKGRSHPGYYYHSDKLMLSLIIFQAFDIQDVYRLEISHVHLEKGTIYIKGSARQQSRILPLEANQIVPLQKYVLEVRPAVLQQKENTWFKPCDEQEAKLFVPVCLHLIRLRLQWKKLNKKVKTQGKVIGIEIRNLQQIRSSRLAVWVKQHGLREAQYKAGFNTISGIERYAKESVEDLQKQLETFHPLK
jgi:site-specific recombinase XerD